MPNLSKILDNTGLFAAPQSQFVKTNHNQRNNLILNERAAVSNKN